MAVPSIVTVNPNTGVSLGQSLIEILGANFRELPDPAPGVIPVPVPGPTVEIVMGGVPAPDVAVVNSAKLIVVIPPHAEGVIDVVVRNLDDNGDPIAGETDTFVNGFTYFLPDLHIARDLMLLTRELVLEMRKQIHPNVLNTSHVDFSDSPSARDLTFIAKLPALVAVGPELLQNKFRSNHGREKIVNVVGDFFDFQRESRVMDVGFEIVGISDRQKELLNLMHVTIEFFHKNKLITFTTAGGVVCELELDFQEGGDPRTTGEPNESNVRQFRGAVLIREFEVDGAILARGANVFDNVFLETQAFVGETLIDPVTGLSIGPLPIPAIQGGIIRSPGRGGSC